MLEQSWTLHYPQDVVLLNSRGLFAPTDELRGDDWLTRVKEAFTLPTLEAAAWRGGDCCGGGAVRGLPVVRARFGCCRSVLLFRPCGGRILMVPAFLQCAQQSSVHRLLPVQPLTFKQTPATSDAEMANSDFSGDGAGMGMGAGGAGWVPEGRAAAGSMPPTAMPESARQTTSTFPWHRSEPWIRSTAVSAECPRVPPSDLKTHTIRNLGDGPSRPDDVMISQMPRAGGSSRTGDDVHESRDVRPRRQSTVRRRGRRWGDRG